MVDYYDLNYDFSRNSLSDSIVNRYIGIMKNKYVSYWNQTLQQSQKLRSTPTRLVWDTTMAAVSLSWDTNMAAVTSCENTLLWSVFKWRHGGYLVFQNNETAAMLVYQENPLGVELFSHVNAFFCSSKLA